MSIVLMATEFLELKRLLPSGVLHQYVPDHDFLQQFGDGGVAIVDQVICSHARLVQHP